VRSIIVRPLFDTRKWSPNDKFGLMRRLKEVKSPEFYNVDVQSADYCI